MPDWIAHILIALIIVEVFKIRKKSLVLLGALLPDFLVKLELLGTFLPVDKYSILWVLNPLHTPIGMALFSLLLLPFFKQEKKKTYGLLSIGWASHLIADMTNRHVLLGQNMLLFPFYWGNIELGIIWPADYYLLLLPLVLIYIGVLLRKRIKLKPGN